VEREQIGSGTGFWGVAAAFGVTMLGTTLPTPLYPLFQRELGFGDAASTALYAVYAAGVLVTLLLFGRSSDVIGRRRVLLAGLACAALSAAAFLSGTGTAGLLVGRVLSGMSAGMVTGTATAALGELAPGGDRVRAALVATVANMLGLGCGPLLSGVLATVAPAPLHLPFVVHAVLLGPAALAVWLAPEPVPPRHGVRLWIDRPALPVEVRTVFVPVAIAMFAAFSMFGLVAALEPSFLVQLLHIGSPLVPATVVFGMFAASAVGQVSSRALPTARALSTGCAVILIGAAGFAVALTVGSAVLLAAATLLIGGGQGVAFRASVAAIGAAAPHDRRAATMSSFFLVVYVGISAPVVLAGAASARWGLRASGLGFTAAVALLLVVALTAMVAPRRTAV
jgi:predicted MFS family arabinose efflux permease